MSFYVVRSIPLSERTIDSLRVAGAIFLRRDRTADEQRDRIRHAVRFDNTEFVLNLGNSEFTRGDLHLPVYNDAELTVAKMLTPTVTRELMGDLMVPITFDSEYIWIKGPGRGGRNKTKMLRSEATNILGYWEDHIEGDEYRIITVGDKIVQQFRRMGPNDQRAYRWVLRETVPSTLKKLARKGARRLDPHSFIAWDTIWTGSQGYILEGNSSPGLNYLTAERVVTGIRNQLTEEANNASNG